MTKPKDQAPTEEKWIVNNGHIYVKGVGNICSVSDIRKTPILGYEKLEIDSDDFAESLANADLIVKAVNSHHELLQALKDIVEECPNPKLPYGQRVVEIAQKAIKRVEKIS